MSSLSRLKAAKAETLQINTNAQAPSDDASVCDEESEGNDDSDSNSVLSAHTGSDEPDISSVLTAILSRLTKLEASASAPKSVSATVSAMKQAAASTPRPAKAASLKDHLRRAHSDGTLPPPRVLPTQAATTGEEASSPDAAADGRLGPIILTNILRHHRSAWDWVQRTANFTNSRNRHEARRIAHAIDAFLQEGVPVSSEGMEILLRNLAGLHKSDEFNDATFLEEMEWAPPECIVPDSVMRPIIKAVKRTKALRPTKKKPSADPKADGGRK